MVIGTHRGEIVPKPSFSTLSRDEHRVATVQGIVTRRSPRNVDGKFFIWEDFHSGCFS